MQTFSRKLHWDLWANDDYFDYLEASKNVMPYIIYNFLAFNKFQKQISQTLKVSKQFFQLKLKSKKNNRLSYKM
jgi:hypothetical protein